MILTWKENQLITDPPNSERYKTAAYKYKDSSGITIYFDRFKIYDGPVHIVHADFKTKLAIIKKVTTFGLTHWIVFHNSTMHKGFDNPQEAKMLFNKLISRFNSTLTVFSIL